MLNGSASQYPRGGDCGSPRVGPLPTRPPLNRTRTHQDRRQPGRGSTARGDGDRAATGRTGPLRRTPGTTHPRGEPRATGEGPISNSLLPLFLPSPSPHPTPPHRTPPGPTTPHVAPLGPIRAGLERRVLLWHGCIGRTGGLCVLGLEGTEWMGFGTRNHL